MIIALPPSNEIVDVFEQSITEGFRCVNKRLVFDTEIFLPNVTKQTNDKDNEINRKDYS